MPNYTPEVAAPAPDAGPRMMATAAENAEGSPMFMIYKNINAWGNPRDEAVLDRMGKTREVVWFIRPVSDCANGVPPGVDVVVFTSNPTFDTSIVAAQNDQACQDSLEAFLATGGTLVVDMADWDEVGGFVAPGATGTPVMVYTQDATVAPAAKGPDGILGTADDHPLVKGADGIAGTTDDLTDENMDRANYTAHGNLAEGITLPENARVLVTGAFWGSGEKPIVAEYPYGGGHVILDTSTKEWGGTNPAFESNLFAYAENPVYEPGPVDTVPSVETPPADQTIIYGDEATFTAEATGTPTPTAQWQVSTDGGQNWADLGGATGTTLTLTKPSVSQSGNRYRAVFTNGAGSVASDAATLTVHAKEVTGGFTAADKVYDGTTEATITGRSITGGVLGDDVVTLTGGTATFEDAAVGSAKTVTGTGFVLGGADAGNYVLGPATLTAKADITKRPLTVTADDKSMTYADPVPPLTYKLGGFVGGETTATSGGSGQPSLTTTATQSSGEGTYPITVGLGTLAASNYSFPSANFVGGTLTVEKRQASVVYTGENYKAIPQAGFATINLSAKVSRSGSSGDLRLAEVRFTVEKFVGGGVQTTAYATSDANGIAATTAQVPTSDDPYVVKVQVAPENAYWTSGVYVDSLQVIVGSGTGRTAGGGWIADAANAINGKSNFGFSVQNAKTGIKGNLLFIYRATEQGNQVQYVVKSNSWQGGGLALNVNRDPARATFTGKATVQRYVNGVFDPTFASGGYTFTVDVLDGALKSPQVADGYAIVVRNGSNQVVKQLGTRAAPITLGGGNVLVQAAK